jgi:methyl-accepting chemotaxis protein
LQQRPTHTFLEKRRTLSKATANYDTASAGFDPEAYRVLIIESEKLEGIAVNAEKALVTQRTSMQVKLSKAREDWEGKFRRFKKQLEERLELGRKVIQNAADAEAEFQRKAQTEQQKVEKANDINTTKEYTQLKAADRKCSDSHLAFQTFDELLHIINIFLGGAVFTAPLRFVIEHLGAKLLNITKLEITGYWTGKKGEVTASLDAVIGLARFSFDNVKFDITNIVELFREIYMRVGKVMNDIGNTLLNIVKQGAEAVKKAIEAMKNGVEIALVEGKEFVAEAAKAAEALAEEVGETVEKVAETVVEAAEKIGDGVQKAAEAVEEGAEKAVEKVVESVQETVHDIEELAEDVSKAVEGGVEVIQKVGLDMGHAVGEATDDIKEAVSDIGEAIDNGASGVVNVLSGVVDDIGKGVGEVVQDVDHLLEDIGNGVDDAVHGVAEGVDSVLEDVGRGAAEVSQSVDDVVEDIGRGVDDVVEGMGSVVDDIGRGVEDVVQGVDSVVEDIGHSISDFFGF